MPEFTTLKTLDFLPCEVPGQSFICLSAILKPMSFFPTLEAFFSVFPLVCLKLQRVLVLLQARFGLMICSLAVITWVFSFAKSRIKCEEVVWYVTVFLFVTRDLTLWTKNFYHL